ncbi:MAG: DNA topoisomerase IB [Anaerolineales bacterium]|nr:DNA topoisomerase IB [Anaerolineales bacterium]MCB9126463.1 DNA topoisomerase IB [Ardenticatenales bacterium]MCB9171623.1 DNA topoisomerase IB [Ardenticatenales bacterium]
MSDRPLRPDPEASAQKAGLTYVTDEMPGFSRKPWGRGFTYLDRDGQTIPQGAARERLEAFAIPPAWTEVWISPTDDTHILATGRDEAGRKQYIYHPDWHTVREEAKFYRMIAFGEALPTIRARVDSDMRKRGLPREKVLAIVVSLLEATLIRVGNREYAEANDSYGLTTLRDKHAKIEGSTIHFNFVGKSGKPHSIAITDRRLARAVKQCREVTGYDLFQYIDDDGQRQTVGSGDVNDYLREVTGQDFTAKDFRTWGGTVAAIATLRACEETDDPEALKGNVLTAIDGVAEALGNSRAVSRAYYIHPQVLSCYEAGEMISLLADLTDEIEGLDTDESAMLGLIRQLDNG